MVEQAKEKCNEKKNNQLFINGCYGYFDSANYDICRW